MGPNGSGKSTLVTTFMGHPNYEVTSGIITFDGANLLERSVEKRAQAGYFFGQPTATRNSGGVFTFLKEAYCALTGTKIAVKEFQALAYEALDFRVLNMDLYSVISMKVFQAVKKVGS